VKKISSWGNTRSEKYPNFIKLNDKSFKIPSSSNGSLAFGNGRSYGDVCFPKDTIILTDDFNRIVSLDNKNGTIVCQSGVIFYDLFKEIIPKGWFLPVVPGTQFISVGGAVANDIHGKNHHSKGSFGNHIIEIKLQDKNNNIITCSRDNNLELFKATIGGLGLTGIILEVKIQLIKLSSTKISQNITPFYSFEEYLNLNKDFESNYEYTVAWVDFGNRKKSIKGIFISGNHIEEKTNLTYHQRKVRLFPITPTISFVNNLTISILNKAYFIKNNKSQNSIVKLNKFFFPLDLIYDWNKAYGKKGFLQYQFVLPVSQVEESIAKIHQIIIDSKIKPSLTVLKTFGDIKPNGYLSFPRKGVSFAIDFPNVGRSLLNLLTELDKVIFDYGGALYPAKDIRMNKQMFKKSYPNLNEFLKYKSPKLNSKFFERVMK